MQVQRERKSYELWQAHAMSVGGATLALLNTPIVHLAEMKSGKIQLPGRVTLRDGSIIEVNRVSVDVMDGDTVIISRFDGIK